MNSVRSFLFFIIFTNFSCYSQADIEDKIRSKYNLNYELNVIDDPMSFRNILINNQDILSDYLHFVLNADRSWYFKYFNRNRLRRDGWNSHHQLYDNRYLAWSSWRNNLLLSAGDFEWYKPALVYTLQSDFYLTELQIYNRLFSFQKLFLRRQFDLVNGKRDVVVNNSFDSPYLDSKPSNVNVKPLRDDILTVLEKKGKKFKIVNLSGPGYDINQSKYNSIKGKLPKWFNKYSGENQENLYRQQRGRLSNNNFLNPSGNNSSGISPRTRTVVNDGSSNASGSKGTTTTVTRDAKQ